jgi:hypothetical protein
VCKEHVQIIRLWSIELIVVINLDYCNSRVIEVIDQRLGRIVRGIQLQLEYRLESSVKGFHVKLLSLGLASLRRKGIELQ